MIDTTTREKITVEPGLIGPSITVPDSQVPSIEAILRANNVSYWVDAYAISVNHEPETTGIHFPRGTSVEQLQRLLDAAN